MGNCATGPKVSKTSEDAEAPIPPPDEAALVTEKKEETTTRDVDLKALETKGEDVSTQEVVRLAVVTAEVAAVVVEGGEEEVVEKVKEVVVEEESTAEDAAGSKRLSLSNLFNKEKEGKKTPEECKKTSSEPTKKVEPSETGLPIKESESERKEAAEESMSVPESTAEPQLAAGVVVKDTPEMAKERVVEVADEKKEKKPEEETKA